MKLAITSLSQNRTLCCYLKDNVVETEETDWAPHEDSAPSTEDYSSQSEEECDGIDSSNTVR